MENIGYSVEGIIKNFQLETSTVLNIYLYGSRVYGTASESSDWDFIVIVEDDTEKISMSNEHSISGNDGNSDAVIMGVSFFQKRINEHQMNALECLWLTPDKILLEKRKFSFVFYSKFITSHFFKSN